MTYDVLKLFEAPGSSDSRRETSRRTLSKGEPEEPKPLEAPRSSAGPCEPLRSKATEDEVQALLTGMANRLARERGVDVSEIDRRDLFPMPEEPIRRREPSRPNVVGSRMRSGGRSQEDLKGLTNILAATLMECFLEASRTELERIVTTMHPGDQVTSAGRWVTPPRAARETGIPVKSIRKMIQDRILPARRRNSSSNPRQAKYLVNVDEVAAEAERLSGVERTAIPRMPLAERASRIRSNPKGR